MKPIKAWAVKHGRHYDCKTDWTREDVESVKACNYPFGQKVAVIVRVEVREVPRKAKR
jgi:hypothetical protein